MEISAFRLPSGNHAGELRFTFTFPCGEACVQAEKVVDWLPGISRIKRAKKIEREFRTSVGLDDISDYQDRLTCAKHETTLERLFTEKYSVGKFGGSQLTEDQAKKFLGEAGKQLPKNVLDLYGWDTLIDRAKNRALPSLR